MYLICGLSQNDCRFLLSSLRLILKLGTSPTSDALQQNLHTDLPLTIDTLLSYMNLEPKSKPHVSCPSCHAIYPIETSKPSAYPTRCTQRRAKNSPTCNAVLGEVLDRKDGSKVKKPIRLYLHHELEDWIARLYSRPELEAHLDREYSSTKPEVVWDIYASPGVQEFIGPDGETPFIKRPGNEGRLVFSLNTDGFNPFGNKESGKKVSTGAIYMVCLTLPIAIRHLIEYMFLVGIIPGPDEPSREQLNFLLAPLVDDLLLLWEHGYFLITTPNYPSGRLVRGAVIPVVCDLPAACQMGSFAGHSSNNFCSYCCLLQGDIDTFDYQSWVSVSVEEHRAAAEQWRDLPSEKERDQLFEQTGIRWSELLRLPYWDPTKYLVIDSMHAFLLGLFQRHCREIWGMNATLEDGEVRSLGNKYQPPDEKIMRNADHIFRSRQDDHLRELPLKVLRELARSTGSIPYGGKKKVVVKHLLQYVSTPLLLCSTRLIVSKRIDIGWFDEDGNALTAAQTQGVEIPPPPNLHARAPASPAPNPPGKRRQRSDLPTDEEVAIGLEILHSRAKSVLRGLRKALLMVLCSTKGLVYEQVSCTHDSLLQLLEKWVSAPYEDYGTN